MVFIFSFGFDAWCICKFVFLDGGVVCIISNTSFY